MRGWEGTRLARFLGMLGAVLCVLATGSVATADDEADAPRRWAVVIVGLPGDAEHASLFDETTATWTNWLRDKLQVADERLFVCAGPARDDLPAGRRSATRESLAATFDELSKKIAERDSLWLFTLGHGHADGARAWLHLPGRDPDGAEFAKWLAPLRCREQVVWATHATSGAWLKPLAKPGRVVITATTAEQEENETEFPHALATVMQAPPAPLDMNADRRVSLAELFRATVQETLARFTADERLPTEHAQLDDDADGTGTEADGLEDENAPTPAVASLSGEPPTGRPAAKPARPKDGRNAANINVLETPAASDEGNNSG